MKKISIIFLCLISIFLITGCEEKEQQEQQLICTTIESEEDMDTEQIISMTFKNDKLNHMTLSVNFKVKDSSAKNNWEEFKKTMDASNEEFNKDGVSQKVETNDQNYEYKTILDIDVENATEEMLKEQGFDGIKDNAGTIESNKEAAEKDGATCVIK